VQASIRNGDAEFVHPIRQAVILLDDKLRDAGEVVKAIEHRYDEARVQTGHFILSRTNEIC